MMNFAWEIDASGTLSHVLGAPQHLLAFQVVDLHVVLEAAEGDAARGLRVHDGMGHWALQLELQRRRAPLGHDAASAIAGHRQQASCAHLSRHAASYRLSEARRSILHKES